MGDVRIGTSGWNYPSGPGAWQGVFYPSTRTVHGHRFDELAYYAEHFNTVEVNASFYRQPEPSTTQRWAQRTPPGFDFSLKLFQKFTHPAMFRQSLRPGAVPDADASPVPAVTQADIDAFKFSLEPLAGAGKLGALLAQFPPSFRNSHDTRTYLDWLVRSFKGYPVVVELRHRSWSDRAADTLALLSDAKAAWAHIDEPTFSLSIREHEVQPQPEGLCYMRLHGRNAEKWWANDRPDERSNFFYSADELAGFTSRINRVRHLVQKLYLYMNNHFAAKAVANAATLSHQLGLPAQGTYASTMLNRYPFLEGVVCREPEAVEDGQEVLPFRKGSRRKGPAGGAESQENELAPS